MSSPSRFEGRLSFEEGLPFTATEKARFMSGPSLYKRVESDFVERVNDPLLIYNILVASYTANPIQRLLEINKALEAPAQKYESNGDYLLNNVEYAEWLRDPSTAARFDLQYRREYLRRGGPPSANLLSSEGGFNCSRSPPPPSRVEYDTSQQGSRHHCFLRSISEPGDKSLLTKLGPIIRFIVLKTIDLENPLSAESVRELFIGMVRIASLPITDVTVTLHDAFPIFEFRIHGVPFKTTPGGVGDIHVEEYLYTKDDAERYRYGKAYVETNPFDNNTIRNVERTLWWLINAFEGRLWRSAKFLPVGGLNVRFNTRAIDNLPELIHLAGLTPEVDRDTPALIDHLNSLDNDESSIPIPVPKGKYLRRRIREWLDANPSAPVLQRPDWLSDTFDRIEYTLPREVIDRLPDDLRIWFQRRVWFVPDPYTVLTDRYIDMISNCRADELAQLDALDPNAQNLSKRERLARLDLGGPIGSGAALRRDDGNDLFYSTHPIFQRWEEISRYPFSDIRNVIDLIATPYSSPWRATFAYYYATRGVDYNEVKAFDFGIIEAYSGNRSPGEIRELLSLMQVTPTTETAVLIRYPYPWNCDRERLKTYIETGRTPPLTPQLEREAARYRFYKSMSVEQHRQASALYMDDPETRMTLHEYLVDVFDEVQGVSSLDPIELDLSRQEVFDATAQRLGVVFPLALSGLDSVGRHAYLINGLYLYRNLLTRDPNVARAPFTVKNLKQLTDTEIIGRLGCYPYWRSAKGLRDMALTLANGHRSFFIPTEPRCLNRRTAVGLEEISELVSERSRFIVAFGTVQIDGAALGEFQPGLPPAVGISGRDAEDRPVADAPLREPDYTCYTFYDLAAGFRPAGLHNDILQYAILNSDGTYRELNEEDVNILIGFTKLLLPVLADEQDRNDAAELLDNIAYLKKHLVYRTDRDRMAISSFTSLNDEMKGKIKLYLESLFEYGMYLRRWKGPGHPYPMREADTLCSEFDMNHDLLAPTGRLQEAHRALGSEGKSFIDSLRMKHYYRGRYSESTNTPISDLIYQLNRQDGYNLCIRMGSSKVVGCAVYYLELLFGVVIERFAIDELDAIQ